VRRERVCAGTGEIGYRQAVAGKAHLVLVTDPPPVAAKPLIEGPERVLAIGERVIVACAGPRHRGKDAGDEDLPGEALRQALDLGVKLIERRHALGRGGHRQHGSTGVEQPSCQRGDPALQRQSLGPWCPRTDLRVSRGVPAVGSGFEHLEPQLWSLLQNACIARH